MVGTVLTLDTLQAFDPQAPRGNSMRRFCCPLCGVGKSINEEHRCLSLNYSNQRWRCHRCGQSGKLGQERYDPHRMDHSILAPRPTRQQKRAWRDVLGESGVIPLPGTPGEKYLRGRGIPLALAQACGVNFARNLYTRCAVVFAMRNEHGHEVGFHARYIDRAAPRMRTLGQARVGAFWTPGAFDRALTITEAPLDALSLALMGVPAIATFGTNLPAWLPRLARGCRVFIATDADEPGDEAAAKWSILLAPTAAAVVRMRPTIGKDWNDELQRSSQGVK